MIHENVFLNSDNAQKLADSITQDVPVILHFLPKELNPSDPNIRLTTLSLTPVQARTLRAARADNAELKIKFTPAMVRMQDGAGFGDMLKSFGTSLLKGAAQGALQGAVNHITGQEGSGGSKGQLSLRDPSGDSHMTHVTLTKSQKDKIIAGHKKKEDYRLQFKHENMSGHDKIPLSHSEHAKFHSAKRDAKGITVTIHHKHIAERGGDMGDFFKNALQFLPMLL